MGEGEGGGEATAKMVVERGGKEHKGSAMLVDLLVCKSKSVCVCVCVCERERENFLNQLLTCVMHENLPICEVD